MRQCNCGSYAINPGVNGRDPHKSPHLCDRCYWKHEGTRLRELLSLTEVGLSNRENECTGFQIMLAEARSQRDRVLVLAQKALKWHGCPRSYETELEALRKEIQNDLF